MPEARRFEAESRTPPFPACVEEQLGVDSGAQLQPTAVAASTNRREKPGLHPPAGDQPSTQELAMIRIRYRLPLGGVTLPRDGRAP